jgi:hypothetical protein
MNGRFQMQGGKNCIFPKECKPLLLGLSLAGNLVKPLFSLYWTEWRERGYGLWFSQTKIQSINDDKKSKRSSTDLE